MKYNLKLYHKNNQIHNYKYEKPVIPISILNNDNNLLDNHSWIRLSSDIEIFRYIPENNSLLLASKIKGKLQFKPYLLVNGYQSNHLTWNFFAGRLWKLGFRNIYSLEINDFTNYEDQYYNMFESAIRLILRSQNKFNKINLIGHSMGGILSRYYIKQREKLGKKPNISLLVTLATPQYGFPKLSNHFETILKHIFVPESVDVLSQDKGVFSIINNIPDQNEYLKLTMINIQGSLKRLAGRDGLFKPEPVSEMINIVQPRSHFHVHKSHAVFNNLIKFFLSNVFIYKIQLESIEFKSTKYSKQFEVYFIIKNENYGHRQRYPIEENIEVSSKNVKLHYPFIIFTGDTVLKSSHKEVKISLIRKKLLSHENLITGSIPINFSKKSSMVRHLTLQNQNVACKLKIISYKLGGKK